ncbi:DUF3368 domain-containing protein, partial [Candidatus Desantisbacteria bacterium]|nr:DUF3368 domain-containing protein [Candidatus Desantisbacteria bacterium]
CNATPLIALAKIDKVDLLRELFEEIYIPEAVYDDVVTRGRNRSGTDEVKNANWIKRKSVRNRMMVKLFLAELDRGEAEVLVLANEINADKVIIDERKGRNAAELAGLGIIGTVGIILLAKRQGKIRSVKELLDKLKDEDFRLSNCV